MLGITNLWLASLGAMHRYKRRPKPQGVACGASPAPCNPGNFGANMALALPQLQQPAQALPPSDRSHKASGMRYLNG